MNREEANRDDAPRDDTLSGFDEELLQRVQAQLERIDFGIEQKTDAHAPSATEMPTDQPALAQQSAVPEGVCFDGSRMCPF